VGNGRIEAIVLDAMGVLFEAADDVAELLLPFVTARGGDAAAVADAYHAASLGHCDADAFWRSVGLPPSVEPAYLAQHQLMPGARAFIDAVRVSGRRIFCLSNDVARWAAVLRQRFELDGAFDLYLTSAELGVRKPEAAAYAALISRAALPASAMRFVDDRQANVAAARRAGFQAYLFEGRFTERWLD